MTLAPDWLAQPYKRPSQEFKRQAELRQSQLTKPPGALGRLEELAISLAALQATAKPAVERVNIVVFAGDHGVAIAGVSAFPQSVTKEMLHNFSRGGAAINVLASLLGATLAVVDVGTLGTFESLPKVLSRHISEGTANFLEGSAMTVAQLQQALTIGKEQAEQAAGSGSQLFIGGEMGIGNTTAASAVAAMLMDRPASDLVGAGTGLNSAGVANKIDVVSRGLALHKAQCHDGLSSLQSLGGFEIAALAGSFIRCAQLGLPVLVDGFIASVAALAALHNVPELRPWLLFSHQSAEAGHRLVLDAMNAKPILNLGMRLGEGSGAAVAVPLLRSACALHNNMATFFEAGVSTQS